MISYFYLYIQFLYKEIKCDDINTLRNQMRQENCDIFVIIDQINENLDKNFNSYINKKEYEDYFIDIIKFTIKNISESFNGVNSSFKLVKHIMNLLKVHNILVFNHLFQLIEIIANIIKLLDKVNVLLCINIFKEITDGMILLHYPYSHPYTTILFDKEQRLSIQKNYKIYDNIHDTILCKENRDKYLLPLCQNNEIAYIDHIRSIYYINEEASIKLARLKLYILYLRFSLNTYTSLTSFFNFLINFQMNFLNLEKLLLEYENTICSVIKKLILWILLNNILCFDDISISILEVQALQINYNKNILRLIIYDYIIAIKEKNQYKKNITFYVLSQIVEININDYRITEQNINFLFQCFRYICVVHGGVIYIELDRLLNMKISICIIQVLLIHSNIIFYSNICHIQYILSIGNKMYVSKIIETIEMWLIRYIDCLFSEFNKLNVYKLNDIADMIIMTLLYLSNIYSKRGYSSKFIINFFRSIINSKMNICFELLYLMPLNTKIEELLFFLSILIYKCYQDQMNFDENLKFTRLFSVIICKNNPKIGHVLRVNTNTLFITKYLANDDKCLPAIIQTYYISSNFHLLHYKNEKNIIDQNKIIESTKSCFEKIKDFRCIKWEIYFINKSVCTNMLWFELFIKELKCSSLNLFEKVYNEEYFYLPLTIDMDMSKLLYYELIGKMIGIGLANNINFKLEMSPIIYKQLLGIKCNLLDFIENNKTIYNEIYNDIHNNKYLRFDIKIWNNKNELINLPLIGDGMNIPVTAENGTRFLHLFSNVYLETGIKDQIEFLKIGISKISNIKYFSQLNEMDLKTLIYGYKKYTSDEVIPMIKFDNEITSNEKGFLVQYIKECEVKVLNTIIRNIIGHEDLEDGKYITVIRAKSIYFKIKRGFASLTLEIPIIHDYVTFKKRMIIFSTELYSNI